MKRSQVIRRPFASLFCTLLVAFALRPALSDEAPGNAYRPAGYPTSVPFSQPWMGDSPQTSGSAHKWGSKKEKRYLKIHAHAADIRRSHGLVATENSGRIVQVAGGATSADSVTVKVDEPEGAGVHVDVINTIRSSLKVHAHNGDTHIINGEALALDVKGGEHPFPIDINLVKTSETENTTEESVELNVSVTGGAEASAGTGGSSVGAKAGGSVGAGWKYSTSTTYKHGSTLSYQPPAQAPAEIKVADMDNGSVPYEKSWTWSSTFNARIGTKATEDGGEAETVLESFTLLNDALVRWEVWLPNATGPSTGEELFAIESITPQVAPRAVLADGTALTASVDDPLGVRGEAGAGEGEILVRMDAVRVIATILGVSTIPSGQTDLPEQLTIPAGEASLMESFEALGTGSYTIRLTVLDELGQPTATVLDVPAEGTSISEVESPDVHLRLDSPFVNATSAGGEALFVSGTQGIGLVAERTGFADYETTPTSISLSVDDPDGLLVGVPPSITIPAGASSAAESFDLTSCSGEATITGTSGTDTWELRIRTGSQALRLPRTSITLPVRSVAYFPVGLMLFQSLPRTVDACSSSPAVVAVATNRSSLTFDPAVRMRLAGFEAVTQGSSTLTFSSLGLDSRTLDVTVVAQDVVPTRVGVTLHGTGGSNSGSIHLRLPEPGVFTSVTLPAGSDSYLTVSGEETDVLSLTFSESVPRPASLTLDYEVSNVPADDFPMEVWDLLRVRGCSYQVTVE